jgi:hypothetical protein
MHKAGRFFREFGQVVRNNKDPQGEHKEIEIKGGVELLDLSVEVHPHRKYQAETQSPKKIKRLGNPEAWISSVVRPAEQTAVKSASSAMQCQMAMCRKFVNGMWRLC